MTVAKLFWSGNSQALRLPKEFRFLGKEVRLTKEGEKVIIEPLYHDWAWLDDLGEADPSLAQAVTEIHLDAPQERDWSIFE